MTLAAYMSETGRTAAEIAAALGVNAEVVRLWRHGHRRISAERAVELSKVTGIPLHQLRPDLWDPPGTAPPEPARRTKRLVASPPPQAKASEHNEAA